MCFVQQPERDPVQQTEAGFGERVKDARTKKGWTQREFASKLDLDASAVSRLEKGTRAVRLGEAAIIAHVLDVPLQLLVEAFDPYAYFRQNRNRANEAMCETRTAAHELAIFLNIIVDLVEQVPDVLKVLDEDDTGRRPTTVDEYLEWILARTKSTYRLPDTVERVVNGDEKRVRQISAIIEATVENVISTVPFPEELIPLAEKLIAAHLVRSSTERR